MELSVVQCFKWLNQNVNDLPAMDSLAGTSFLDSNQHACVRSVGGKWGFWLGEAALFKRQIRQASADKTLNSEAGVLISIALASER